MNVLILIGFFAGFNEVVMEYIFGQWKDASGHSILGGLLWGRFLPILSLALGVAECFVINMDALVLMGYTAAAAPPGYLVTGVVIGMGSQAVHKFFPSLNK